MQLKERNARIVRLGFPVHGKMVVCPVTNSASEMKMKNRKNYCRRISQKLTRKYEIMREKGNRFWIFVLSSNNIGDFEYVSWQTWMLLTNTSTQITPVYT